jgi:hypothetical protein
MERTTIAGLQLAYCRRSTHDQEQQEFATSTLSHGEPHRSGLQRSDKNWLDELAQTNLLECAVGNSARQKLIHTMPLNTDRPINRATVVGCAISATPNYLKFHGPTKSIATRRQSQSNFSFRRSLR